jgi:hypothetical protein
VVRKLTAAPGVLHVGDVLTVSDRVVNTGRARAASSLVGYYLAGPGPGSGSATRHRIGRRSTPSLKAGARSPATTRLRLPRAIGPGKYRLEACADDTGKARELHERNNCATAPVTIKVINPVPTRKPSSSASAPALTNAATIRVDYTARSTGSALAKVELYARTPGGGFAKVATDAAPAASGHFSYTAAAGDGAYDFYTLAYDRAGNLEPAPAGADATTTLDQSAPSSSASAAARTNAATIQVDYSAADTGSGLAKVELYAREPGGAFAKVATDAAPTAAGHFSYTAAAGDGAYHFYTLAYDKAGNLEPAPPGPDATTTLDTSAPSVTLTQPANGSTTDLTTFAGDAGTAAGDLQAVEVNIYLGTSTTDPPVQTLSATQSGGSWSATAAPLAPGLYTARAEQHDAAGNAGRSSSTFTVPVSLLAAGDIAGASSTGATSTAALLLGRSGTVAPLGDNAYESGTAQEYTSWYDPTWGAFKSRTAPTPGNHEYTTSGPTGYFGYFGAAAGEAAEGYYSYDLGAWHVIVLNTSNNCGAISCAAGQAQEQWLRNDLARHTAQCTLAYFHHPRFSTGIGANVNVQPLWQALYDGGADVVLNGHAHDYERFAPQDPAGTGDTARGLREFIVGTGGRSHEAFTTTHFAANSQAHDDETFGILDLTLRATSYSWQFVPVDGGTFTDSGTATCH